MAGLFDYLDSINTGKGLVLDSDNPCKDYIPYQINNGLSQNLDTILVANEMNKRPWLSKEMQFKFFSGAITKKKRFSKWAKVEAEANPEDVSTVSTYYSVNRIRAGEYLKLIQPHELEYMRKMNDKGGCDMPRGKKTK